MEIREEQVQFLIDGTGKRVGVVLDCDYYQGLLSRLEELEEIYAYDLAKATNEETIPLEQALAEIEQDRA